MKIQIIIHLPLGLHEGRPNYRGSLQPSKKKLPALQNQYIYLNQLPFILCDLFADLDPDPHPTRIRIQPIEIETDPRGSRSESTILGKMIKWGSFLQLLSKFAFSDIPSTCV